MLNVINKKDTNFYYLFIVMNSRNNIQIKISSPIPPQNGTEKKFQEETFLLLSSCELKTILLTVLGETFFYVTVMDLNFNTLL